MRKPVQFLSVLLCFYLVLAGCGQPGSRSVAEYQVREGALTVCASFYTMADFAGKIAGDRAEVINLLPSGGEPHDWEPTPQDIALLEQADLLIINGMGFEHWVDGVVPTLSNSELQVVDTSALLSSLREEHGDEGLHEDQEGHDHGGMDPHIWLNPMNARLQLEAIAAALIAADPEGEALYRENLEKYSGECEALDREYRQALESLPRKEIVVAHAAFGYLCDAYGLEQVAVQGLAPEGEPDPAAMAAAVDFAREHDAKVIFFEQAVSSKVADAIAREIGAETAVLDPLEGAADENGDYFSVMRENLEQLKRALQ